ncbi:pVII [Polar bear adenovirus 1]|uniref:PVII n=1 Tax=Polar bear adenovirus 1 TaxID=2250215 RepID=A0A2Z4QJM1_9ADEN|nr:pVII [Polar bear adenovirus 1]AWY10558.1 pVII [Polar bear adenovirus 1]AXI68655.1 pVII [Polar bear adenovirus 1]
MATLIPTGTTLKSPSNNSGWGLGLYRMYGGAKKRSAEHPVLVRKHYRAPWGSKKRGRVNPPPPAPAAPPPSPPPLPPPPPPPSAGAVEVAAEADEEQAGPSQRVINLPQVRYHPSIKNKNKKRGKRSKKSKKPKKKKRGRVIPSTTYYMLRDRWLKLLKDRAEQRRRRVRVKPSTSATADD